MKRLMTKMNVGENLQRIKIFLSTDDCEAGTIQARVHLADLLHNIADQPDLVACGLAPFEVLKIYHDGSRYVAEAEAIVKIE